MLTSITKTFNCSQPCITSINNSHNIHPITSSRIQKPPLPISPLCKINSEETLANFPKSRDNHFEENDYLACKRAEYRHRRMSSPNGLALELIYISYQKLVPNNDRI